jgi:hypothetical protein
MNKSEAQARAAAASGKMRHKASQAADAHLLPLMRKLRKGGYSFGRIAAHLNEAGHRTRTGKLWQAATVYTVLRRARY